MAQAARNGVEQFVLERARTNPGELAVVDAVAGTRLTRAQVAVDAGRAAAALRDIGVFPEQRVMLVLSDTPAFLAFFWGAMWMGAIPVPVSTMLTDKDYRPLIEDSRAAVVVVSPDHAAQVAPALSDQPHLRVALVDGPDPVAGLNPAAPILAAAGDPPPVFPAGMDSAALWLYTSGTTGQPKGAIHRHADLGFLTESFGRGVLGMDSGDVVFSVAKLFFAYGLGNSGYMASGTGATAVLHRGRPTAGDIADLVSGHGVTLVFAVPTMYARLLSSDIADDSFASVRLGVSAAEPLPEDIYRRFLDRFGVEILDGIGTTELGQAFISQRPGSHRPNATGWPVDGVEIELRDPDGALVEPGSPGALWVAAESVTAGYWNRTDRNRTALHGRFFRTGDTFVHNEDGSYTYLGRDDDMLKVGGIWVSPAEVEACIVEMPDVLSAAVVGAADGDGMIKPRAFVIPASGAERGALPAAVQAHVKSCLAPFKYPRWVDIVDELPMTATGKVKRYVLRARPLA